MTQARTVSLSELVSVFYEEYLALYGDEVLAAVAAAATINELLSDTPGPADEPVPRGHKSE
jgi:hypothetical protein